MKLIVTDRPLRLSEQAARRVECVDLSMMKIANCMGCFGCWTRTPGKCVIRDDAVQVYPRIAACDRLLYVSRVRYGGYDTVMKTMLERAIPVQQAFLRLCHGETHHVQRRVVPKEAVIVGYGTASDDERELFRRLVARNAQNMSFAAFRVLFPAEDEVERIVEQEVCTWAGS